MPPKAKKKPWIALLRGINVGGRKSLAMKDLARLCEELGCEEVRTVIQSGNVVFTATKKVAGTLSSRLEKALRKEFGLDVPVVVRSLEEWESVVEDNPFLTRGADPKELHVAFLADRPRKEDVEALNPDRSPRDDFVVWGSEVYLRLPDGVARTKLDTRYLDATLGTTSTLRNWRTVLRLRDIAREAEG